MDIDLFSVIVIPFPLLILCTLYIIWEWTLGMGGFWVILGMGTGVGWFLGHFENCGLIALHFPVASCFCKTFKFQKQILFKSFSTSLSEISSVILLPVHGIPLALYESFLDECGGGAGGVYGVEYFPAAFHRQFKIKHCIQWITGMAYEQKTVQFMPAPTCKAVSSGHVYDSINSRSARAFFSQSPSAA